MCDRPNSITLSSSLAGRRPASEPASELVRRVIAIASKLRLLLLARCRCVREDDVTVVPLCRHGDACVAAAGRDEVQVGRHWEDVSRELRRDGRRRAPRWLAQATPGDVKHAHLLAPFDWTYVTYHAPSFPAERWPQTIDVKRFYVFYSRHVFTFLRFVLIFTTVFNFKKLGKLRKTAN